MDVLCRYDWPGNVRELENVILRTLVSTRGDRMGVDDLPPDVVFKAMGIASPAAVTPDVGPSNDIIPLDQLEEQAIRHALQVLDGNISLAAKRLGVGRATLYRKVAALEHRTTEPRERSE